MRDWTGLCALLLAGVPALLQAQEDPRPALAIAGARVVVAPGEVLPSANVIVRGGVIVAVGPEIPIPADARRIEGKGRTVYAGFVDGLTHDGFEFGALPEKVAKARSELGWDRTTQVPVGMDPGRRDGIFATRQVYRGLFSGAGSWAEHRKAGFTAGLVAPKEGFVAGKSALTACSDALPRHALLAYDNAQHVRFDHRHKAYPSTTMGTLAYLRQLFSDARWHAEAWRIYRKAGEQGLRRPPLDAELMALNTSSFFFFHAQTANEIHRALDLAQEFGLRAGIAGGRQALELIERLKRSGAPVVLSLAWPEKPKDPAAKDKKKEAKKKEEKKEPPKKQVKKKAKEPPDLPPRVYQDRLARWNREARCAIALHQAGIRFVFSTAGVGPKKALERIEQLIGWGLPADAALAALTTRPAELYLGGTTLGRIARGRAAHLLVCKGTLGQKLAVLHAIVDGRLFDLTRKSGVTGKPQVDLTGKWALSSSTDFGKFSAMATIKQDKGGALSGEIVTRYGSAQIVKGQVGGTSFEFTAVMKMGQQSAELEFAGSAEGGKLDGTITFGWDGKTREFSARRPGRNGR